MGKTNLIYVKNFIESPVERQILNCQNDNSGMAEMTTLELSEVQGNNTDIKNTESSDTDPFFSSGISEKEDDANEEYQRYFQYFTEVLEMGYLFQEYPYDRELLENILELIVETVCSKRKVIRIASDDKPSEIVKSRLMKLNSGHIRFILTCFKENTTKVRNIKQYLLATIYNAPITMDGYYDALVRHDMAHGVMEGGK